MPGRFAHGHPVIVSKLDHGGGNVALCVYKFETLFLQTKRAITSNLHGMNAITCKVIFTKHKTFTKIPHDIYE